jgi:hypothetical protein
MATSKREITEAKGYLERNGYEVTTDEIGGHLIVQDPVRRCGLGAQNGTLIPVGFKLVAIRDNVSAIRFVQDRS